MPRCMRSFGSGKNIPLPIPLAVVTRMFSRCVEDPSPNHFVDTPCFIFSGYCDPDGYAEIKFKGKKHRASRVMWTAVNGSIEDGYDIDHMCGRRDCLNPLHLYRIDPFTNRVKLRDERRQVYSHKEEIPI